MKKRRPTEWLTCTVCCALLKALPGFKAPVHKSNGRRCPGSAKEGEGT